MYLYIMAAMMDAQGGNTYIRSRSHQLKKTNCKMNLYWEIYNNLIIKDLKKRVAPANSNKL